MLPPQEKVVNGTSQVAAHGEAPLVQEAASAAERAAGWKTPPSRMQEILWSGSKRHVFLGMLGISAIAAIPWLLLTSGILDSLYGNVGGLYFDWGLCCEGLCLFPVT